MANDFKIVSGDSPHCWSIDSKGKVSDVVQVDAPGLCAVWVDDSEEFTKAQADDILAKGLFGITANNLLEIKEYA